MKLSIKELQYLLAMGGDYAKAQYKIGDNEDASQLALITRLRDDALAQLKIVNEERNDLIEVNKKLLKRSDLLELKLEQARKDRKNESKELEKSEIRVNVHADRYNAVITGLLSLVPGIFHHGLDPKQAVNLIQWIGTCSQDKDVSFGTAEEIRAAIGLDTESR